MLQKLTLLSCALTDLASLVASYPTFNVAKRDISPANAEAAYNALQQWYNQDNGLWIPSTGWWNSANCLTVIANLAAVDDNVKSAAGSVFSTTYAKAPQYNLQMIKVSSGAGQSFLPQTYYGSSGPSLPFSLRKRMPVARAASGFLNDYYDDEGWWALGWIAVYDVTGNEEYLSQAQAIFDDMNAVFGQTNCSTNSGGTGGIWWDKAHTYVNAIANELFLDVAAHLANRPRLSSSADYVGIAKQQWAWFQGTGMINSGNTINDGLDQQSCQNNQGTVWSYNQGVILGALAELSKATGDSSYLSTAQNIADAAIAALAPSGVLKDPCEPDCGGDGTQFKGVFARNIQILEQASPQDRYAAFLDTNANSIWQNDNSNNELSVQWAGPFVSPANASTQSSAMDALVGSLAT